MFITSFLVPTLFTELQTCQVTHSRAQLDYYAFWFTPGFGIWTAFHTNLDRRMEMSHAVGHSFSSCARTILGPTTVHCVAIINAFIVSHTPKCTDSDDVYAVSQFENSVYCKPVQSSLLPYSSGAFACLRRTIELEALKANNWTQNSVQRNHQQL